MGLLESKQIVRSDKAEFVFYVDIVVSLAQNSWQKLAICSKLALEIYYLASVFLSRFWVSK